MELCVFFVPSQFFSLMPRVPRFVIMQKIVMFDNEFCTFIEISRFIMPSTDACRFQWEF